MLSEIFVLWGTWKVLIRYEYLRPKMKETPNVLNATVGAGVLGFLGLYHLCLLFALSFAWLSFSDLNVINAIAKARNGLEIAFTAFHLSCTICTVVWVAALEDRTSNISEDVCIYP